MTARLTVVPAVAEPQRDGPHPMELARKALREAALAEADSFWREHLLRIAGALPARERG